MLWLARTGTALCSNGYTSPQDEKQNSAQTPHCSTQRCSVPRSKAGVRGVTTLRPPGESQSSSSLLRMSWICDERLKAAAIQPASCINTPPPRSSVKCRLIDWSVSKAFDVFNPLRVTWEAFNREGRGACDTVHSYGQFCQKGNALFLFTWVDISVLLFW